MIVNFNDTIVALSTPQGIGALALIRLTGDNPISICNPHISKDLYKCESHTAHYVQFADKDGQIDECIVTLFKNPKSYTGEETVEISCHSSPYIIKKIINTFLNSGARLALPGEFTQRAFLNGQMDLAQAEAVGDLIASKTSAQHEIALRQMKGGLSNQIKQLRQDLIEFASLIELENDFGEEDVEFADRLELKRKVTDVLEFVISLQNSFEYGNAIKEGIPVAIIGKPNVGKSTLLNALLNEDKAIVSEIPGTTRDVIEDSIQIEGYLFRFIDTAGIRKTNDKIEGLGIQKTYEQIEKAKIVLLLAEIDEDFKKIVQQFEDLSIRKNQKSIILLTKVDLYDHDCHSYDIEESVSTLTHRTTTVLLSAKTGLGLVELKKQLLTYVSEMELNIQNTIVTNLRHFHSLEKTRQSLESVQHGLHTGVPSDLIAIDLRHALNYLGEIAGEISTEDLLDTIFSTFCIGK